MGLTDENFRVILFRAKEKIPRDLFATCETSRRFRSLECMGRDFHDDQVVREELILRYLERRLDTDAVEEWEKPLPGVRRLL